MLWNVTRPGGSAWQWGFFWSVRMQHPDAEEVCRAQGGHLVTVDSPQVSALLGDKCNSEPNRPPYPVLPRLAVLWTGLHAVRPPGASDADKWWLSRANWCGGQRSSAPGCPLVVLPLSSYPLCGALSSSCPSCSAPRCLARMLPCRKWYRQTNSTYSLWPEGNPDNFMGLQGRYAGVLLDDSMFWDDYYSHHALEFVCERQL